MSEPCPTCMASGDEFHKSVTGAGTSSVRTGRPCPVCEGEGFLGPEEYEAFWSYVQATKLLPLNKKDMLRKSVSTAP